MGGKITVWDYIIYSIRCFHVTTQQFERYTVIIVGSEQKIQDLRRILGALL